MQSQTYILNSTDDGSTWSNPVDFFGVWRPVLPPGMSGARPAVGHGIQLLSHGAQAGRLIVPMVCTNATAEAGSNARKQQSSQLKKTKPLNGDRSCMSCNSCILYSDDHGESWLFGGVAQQGSREAQLVETSTPPAGPATQHLGRDVRAGVSALYVNARNLGTTPGHRMIAQSKDGGETLGGFAIDGSLVTPVTAHWTGVVASVVGVGGKGIVYSGASDAAERKVMALRRSTNSGKSWGAPRVLWGGPAAYSDLAHVNATHIAVVYENGDVTFADRVSVSIVALDWI